MRNMNLPVVVEVCMCNTQYAGMCLRCLAHRKEESRIYDLVGTDHSARLENHTKLHNGKPNPIYR